ncbi:hypothetical protein M406DRAFT_269221 [Cryphonectria parasitica EP155]|uniref:HTH TFE/IIEalpha-type domain-containing protein n=1 Tax=Cryphonectria parasitica (strain ATCC 38755 / EP155) TaxID=660469 RepID=A0A9P4XSY4_CRYP1|nr:uncharacterized protein M406DRAFT_269221 [Cryphonectria parasitica EP155]KAF3760227.1 hypothetical protein M406DRAFT_269221 [Cryphonectria parasitica EP155]
MDLAKQLVRSCARAFYSLPPYDVRYVLIVDALVIHGALRDDDLGYLLNITAMKDLHKLCYKLQQERFLQIHVRQELKEGAVRPSNRTYYYIDYRQTIDAIKWRVYKLGKDMQVPTVPASERKEYVCPRCKADYTQLEVLSMASRLGFACERCGAVLSHEIDRTSAGHEKVTRLNNQLKFITDLLLRIDNVAVPDNNFEYAIETALPVDRDEQHQVARATVVEPVKPTSVKGLADTGPKKIDIKISTSEGPTEEEKEAERLRKEKIAQQNALPAWMANSTVSGDSFSATPTGEAVVKAEPEKQADDKKQGLDAKEAQELSSYMEDLKREQEAMAAAAAAAALKKQEDSDDEEEEDDDDPDDEDDRPAKKIKVEEPAPTAGEDDDDDEEGLEFEDV